MRQRVKFNPLVSVSALLVLIWGAVLASNSAAAAISEPSQITVVLVRHAEKQPDGSDPGLTDAGRARAEALTAVLRHSQLRAVITSPLNRTRDTAAPVAAAFGIAPVEVGFDSGLDGHIQAVADRVREINRGTVLVVGHSNTVPAIINALGGPAIADLCESAYSDLFVLTLSATAPQLLQGRYGATDQSNGC